MSPRDARSGDEPIINRYVLGQLRGAELETLEGRLLADHALFEEMEAIEAEICDDYAAGRLAPEDRAGFEMRLVTHDGLRQKVAFARALAAAVPASGRAGDSTWRWWALAAAAIVVIAGAWWFARSGPGPDAVVVSQTPPPTPSPVVPAVTPTPAAPPGVLRPTPSVSTVVATLTLFGPVVRDPGAAPVLAISGGAGVARLEVALQDGDVFPSYRMTVTRAGGDVWNGDRLPAVTAAGGRLLRADIAVDALPAGTYHVSVYGLPAGGAAPARLSSYSFRVTRDRAPAEMF